MPEKDLIQRFDTHQRMTMVADSWRLRGEDLGRFLRKNGISSPELESWRTQMKEGLDKGKPLARSYKRELEAKIERLKKELEKARAINELQKKAQKIWEEDAARKAQAKHAARSSKRLKK